MGSTIETAGSGFPQLRTPLPGPKAREIIERDGQVLSPSYTRHYPLVIKRGEGAIIEDVDGKEEPLVFSEQRTCCGHVFPELSPQSFSFNSPLGMCSACNGLGTSMEVDPDLVIPDQTLSIRGGAIAPWVRRVLLDLNRSIAQQIFSF